MANKLMHNLVIRDNNYEIVDASVRLSMADEYNSLSTYSIGNIVLYNGQLYKCNTAINTAEAWTAAHWTAITIGDEISDLKTNLDGKLDEPSTAGTSGQVLTSNGSGGQYWSTPSGGGGGSAVTYSISISNNVITLTGSDSSTSTVTLPVYNGGVSS